MGTRAEDNGRSNPKTSEEREGLVPTSDAKKEHDLHHKLFFEASGDGMLLAATDGNILDANRAACHILKRAREEVIAAGLGGIFDPSDPRLKNAWEEQRRTGRFGGELRLRRGDGTFFPAEVSFSGFGGEDGEGEIGVLFRDITWRKQAEEELRQSKEFFRLLVENALDIIMVSGSDATSIYWNPAVEEVAGYRPEELIGATPDELMHPDDAQRMLDTYMELITKPETEKVRLEARWRHKDGSWRWIEGIGRNMLDHPSVRGFVNSARDVTERKQLEEKLQFLSLLVENAEDIIGVTEADGTIRYMSPSVERVLGYQPEEMVGTNSFDYMHPDELEWAAGVMADAENTPGPSQLIEFRYRHKDGSWRYLESTGHNLLEDPHVGGILFVSRDITTRKRAEEALRESEQRLRMLTENMLDFILVSEADGAVRYLSPSFEGVLGYTPEEFAEFKPHDVVHPDDVEEIMGAIAEARANPGVNSTVEARYRHKDGSWRWISSIANNLLHDPDVGALVISGRDVTERKRAENALREAEEKYRALIEQVPVVTYMDETDDLASSIYVSPQVEGLLGYSLEEWDEDRLLWSKRLHPEDESRVHAECYRCRDSGEMFKMEYRLIAKDGSVVWVRDDATVVHDEEGRPRYWRGVKLDITEQKRAEEEIRHLNETLEKRVAKRTAQLEDAVARLESNERMLRESEEKFRTTFDQAAVGIAHVAPDGRWLGVNRKLCEIVGYAREELLQKTFQDITHSDDLENDLDNLRRMLAGEIDTYSIEKRYVKKDYSKVWVNLTVSLVREPSGDPGYFISVVEDITERKQAERVLRSLTSREIEVLQLLARGYTNPEIAQEMAFSVSTVKNHIQQIIHKLGVADRTQAAVRAVELGLIESE